jgi:hypothetical protein
MNQMNQMNKGDERDERDGPNGEGLMDFQLRACSSPVSYATLFLERRPCRSYCGRRARPF